MNEKQFWQLIEETQTASQGSCKQQADLLRLRLVSLSAEDIIEFDRLFQHFQDKAYSWHLWSAAIIIGDGGCSDDSFTDFRAWLIGQGKDTYYDVLDNPDRLADIIAWAETAVALIECVITSITVNINKRIAHQRRINQLNLNRIHVLFILY